MGTANGHQKQKDEHLGRTSALSASLLERLSGEGGRQKKKGAAALRLT
jgi:hypothetical protein